MGVYDQKCKAWKKTIFLAGLLLFFMTSRVTWGSQLLDEFSAIYHSGVIIEVGVQLDRFGHPKESCHLKTIKGGREEVDEVLKQFGVCKKRRNMKVEQKRLMFLYRNGNGNYRSMNLIRKGVGPYSDQPMYKDFQNFIKKVIRWTGNQTISPSGMIVLKDSKICETLKKNDYFKTRYPESISSDEFVAGGDAGMFQKFSPLVRIQCGGEDQSL